MNHPILVTAGIVVVATTVLWWLRRRARKRRLGTLVAFNSLPASMNRAELLRAISGLHLAQVGHSRRIDDAIVRTDRILLFGYTCETGLEHERHSHRWRVAMSYLDHGLGRATFTSQDWLLAAAWRPSLTRLPAGRQADSGFVGLVEDVPAWQPLLESGLAGYFDSSHARRCWEILPGMVVVYEPGRFEHEAQAELREKLAGFCTAFGASREAEMPSSPS